MTILRTNIDTTNKKEVYRLTKGDSLKVDGLEKGLSIPVEKYCLYEEEKERTKQDGSVEEYTQVVLTFVCGNQKYGTISSTFIRSFIDVIDIMEDDPFAIIITGGTSRGGRHFVNCELDCDF